MRKFDIGASITIALTIIAGIIAFARIEAKVNYLDNYYNKHEEEITSITNTKKNEIDEHYKNLKKEMRQLNTLPIGTIIAFAGNLDHYPEGWLLCDGTLYAEKDYPELYVLLKQTWGGGQNRGLKTFNVPDLQGRFLRGYDPEKKFDREADDRIPSKEGGAKGNTVGSAQLDSTRRPRYTDLKTENDGSHNHTTRMKKGHYNDSGGSTEPRYGQDAFLGTLHIGGGPHSHTINAGGDFETRPVNVAVNWLIKAN